MQQNKIIYWCDKIIAFSYYALIYFLPISIALCESFAGATLFFFFVKRGTIFVSRLKELLRFPQRPLERIRKISSFIFGIVKPVDSYLSRPIGFFILVCALSVLKSQYLVLSLQGFFFKILQWTYLYFVFIECIKSQKQIRIFTVCFLVSVVLLSIDGLVQYLTGVEFIFGQPMLGGRINASFRHPNDFGAYLIVACLFVFSLFLNVCFESRSQFSLRKNPFSARIMTAEKVILSILLVLSIYCLGLTYSRAAWIGFLGALLFFGWHKKKYFLASLLVAVLFLFFFLPQLAKVRKALLFSDHLQIARILKEQKIFDPLFGDPGDRSSEDYKSRSLKSYDGPFTEEDDIKNDLMLEQLMKPIGIFGGAGREAYWREAIRIIQQSPFLGCGVNTYSQVAPRYKITWGGYPHNSFLHMAAEIGLIGLGIFSWILLSLFRKTLKHLRLMKNSDLAFILLGLLSGLLGFLIHSFFDTDFYSVQLGNLMWVIMGAVMAIQKMEDPDSH